MKIILHFALLLTLSLIHTNLNGQKMIDFGKVWYELDGKGFSPNICTNVFEFRSDTSINGRYYLELYYRTDTSTLDNWKSTGQFYREDTSKRIYIRESGVERLLFDFSLEIGDSITLSDAIVTCSMTIIQVDTIMLLNGNWRKQLTLISSQDDINNPLFGYFKWVEGVGSLTSFRYHEHACFTDFDYVLLCHYEDGKLLYSNDRFSTCFISTSVNEQNYNRLRIVPNPVRDVLNIESSDKVEFVEIYDLNGRCVLVSEFAKNDISHLMMGIYIVNVYIGEERVVRRIIKD